MEKTAFADITNYKELETYVVERLDSSKDNYLFIDEVQDRHHQLLRFLTLVPLSNILQPRL